MDPLIKSQLLYQLSYAPARRRAFARVRFHWKPRAYNKRRFACLFLAAASEPQIAMDIDAHHQAEAEHHREHGRAAVRYER